MERCSRLSRGLVLIVFALCSGCALYNPYVSVGQKQGVCGEAGPNTGLDHACKLKAAIASSRKQQVVVQNYVATGLIPLGAVIGLRTARNLSSAATAEFAAAALAGYGLSQFLIQPSRLVVYDRGYTAISCALSLYSEENAKLTRLNPTYGRFQSAMTNFLQQANEFHADKDNQAREMQMMGEMRSGANFLNIDVRQFVTGTLDASLGAAAHRIESEVNTAITSTALTLTALNPQIEAIVSANSKPAATTRQSLEAMTQSESAAAPAMAGVKQAFELLVQAYGSMMEQGATATLPDFSKCTVGMLQVQPTPPEQPLSLGVNNSLQGTITEFKDSEALTAQLFGGRAPFAAEAMAPENELTAKVLQVGAAYTVVVEKQSAAKADMLYVVLVSDAAGALREFKVKIPASGGTAQR